MNCPEPFVGWFKPEGQHPWEPVCSGRTYDECWRLLLQHKPPAVSRCEKVVLPAGFKP